MLSSRTFTVSELMFKFLIRFKFIFGNDVSQGHALIFLHVAVQYSQKHSLKRRSLRIEDVILESPLKYQVVSHMRVYFWALESVQSVHVSILYTTTMLFDCYGLVMYFEISKCDVSSCPFSGLFWPFRIFHASIKMLVLFFFPLKNATGIL